MKKSPLLKIREFGQSIWLDFIRRGMLLSGEFQVLISDDGLLGVTSNPSIFEKSITGSHDYDQAIRDASLQQKNSKEIYEMLTIPDIQKAADLFRPTFVKTKGRDGFVSLEVSPHLARDTEGTIVEARRLWKTVARSNVMIKVPATIQGLPAIKQLISEGINVNATLLFSLERYNAVAEAYISGLEIRAREHKPLEGIASVASFFLSRIDIAVDALLPTSSGLRGQAAIASAKVAYQDYKDLFSTERFERLKKRGAQSQRLLWASTSTKDPHDSDVKYVEALIGPETVNTLPLETLNAYRDHGNPSSRLEDEISEARKTLKALPERGIDLKEVTAQLEEEGLRKFSVAFDKLMTALELKRQKIVSDAPAKVAITLSNCSDAVQKRLALLDDENYCGRVWRKDTSLWKTDPVAQAQIKKSLGWLHIAEKMEESLKSEIEDFVTEIRQAGFEHVVHMGMGGSSLAPLVFARTFSSDEGLPLTVLDTTDPVTIKKLEDSIPLEKTLFIVASKSGTTAEPLAFKDYFYEKVRALKGTEAGENFVAITDPGTPLVKMAKEQGFRKVFFGALDIGGRYSALSYFGLVPAALMGVNIREILSRALQAEHSAVSCDPGVHSSSLILGAVLGEMNQQKKDKVTLLVDEPLVTIGLWLEQLMAESTGKEGKGLIPISNEPLGEVSIYGEDRLFVHLSVKNPLNLSLKAGIEALIKAGHPVVTLEISDLWDLGKEFFEWEFATAVAGSILAINAFDQPNVQESKDNTDRLLAQISQHRPLEKPKVLEGVLGFYTSLPGTSGKNILGQFLELIFPGDYLALMAFLPESKQTSERLLRLRTKLRDSLKLATTLGYGPRFLHSTGQLHKGGPATGVFLQLTADDVLDLAIPGRVYSFSEFKQAQAEGDLQALRKHGDRVMRIHLGRDSERGFSELEGLLDNILRSK